MVLWGCGKLRGWTSCEVLCSTSSQPDKKLYVCVCVANDVGQGCYGAMKVRDAFANAYRELRDAVLPQYEHLQSNCSSFLGRILLVPLEVVKYRHVIQKRWQIRPCSLSSSSSSSSAADDPPSYSEHLPSSSSSVAAAAAAVGDTLLTQLIDDRHVLHYIRKLFIAAHVIVTSRITMAT